MSKGDTDGQLPVPEPVVIDAQAYLCADYARAERDNLWRKVWQQAGRVEDIPNIGDYITYDVLDDSILIVRTAPDRISAYHNVCQHRGRRLVDTPPGARNARGNAKRFVCGFHGWAWDMNGTNVHVRHGNDWNGRLTAPSLRLVEVGVDTWGGWIWINMDPQCEPLRDYLEPAASMLDPFELHEMRYLWRRWVVFDCNWKVGLEAFLEGYHFPATHPQFMRFGEFYSVNVAQGKHSNSYSRARKATAGSKPIVQASRGDPRVTTAQLQNLYREEMNAVTTRTLVDAASRLVEELPQGTPADEVARYWLECARRDDAARGVRWPQISPQHLDECGSSWTVFPNLKIIQLPTAAICHGFRPHGFDPNKCIYDAVALERFPAGEEPATQWAYTPASHPDWLRVLHQDFSNMAAVQRGMKSGGFRGPRPNPVQETGISNFHRSLAEYMGTEAPRPLAK